MLSNVGAGAEDGQEAEPCGTAGEREGREDDGPGDRPRHLPPLYIQVKALVIGTLKYNPIMCRVSYCSADALFSHVFAFIAVNKDESMECHAFLCRKRKIVSWSITELS